MCGRYVGLDEDDIEEVRALLAGMTMPFAVDRVENGYSSPREVRPRDTAAVITAHDDGAAFESLTWGFMKWNSSGVIFNARSESLGEKKLFSGLLGNGRCVIPAEEFFEWEKLTKGKLKYRARDKNGNLLYMAGLYRDIKNAENETREFVIITKEATGEMVKIHDRLPVLLTPSQVEPWLDGSVKPAEIVNLTYEVVISPCEEAANDSQITLF